MDWNFDTLENAKRYKLLVSLVVPRPIALVTTLGLPGTEGEGVVNAAPFSFFNVIADEPPIVIISIENRDSGPLKDSSRNMLASGQFVVNLVDESIAERMHACSTDFPPGVSEPEMVGFTLAPSSQVAPPRLVEAPAALECTLYSKIEMPTRNIIIGQVRHLHVRDELVDPETFRVHIDKYHPVGRLFANRYCRISDQFEMTNNSYLEQRRKAGKV
jgi:flavin reductase (DIM6/NTAB) family NADH-FMN oxidoreductase RutF